jgi:hypothetical protein
MPSGMLHATTPATTHPRTMVRSIRHRHREPAASRRRQMRSVAPPAHLSDMSNHTIAAPITSWAELRSSDREVLNRAEVAALLTLDPRTTDRDDPSVRPLVINRVVVWRRGIRWVLGRQDAISPPGPPPRSRARATLHAHPFRVVTLAVCCGRRGRDPLWPPERGKRVGRLAPRDDQRRPTHSGLDLDGRRPGVGLARRPTCARCRETPRPTNSSIPRSSSPTTARSTCWRRALALARAGLLSRLSSRISRRPHAVWLPTPPTPGSTPHCFSHSTRSETDRKHSSAALLARTHG